MSDKNCTSCGALYSEGLVCQYCGRATSYFNSIEDENRALDELHNLLQSLATDKEDLSFEEIDKRNARAAQILETGFIPDHKAVLIEAGVYCLALIKDYSDLSAAAVHRLNSVATKLKFLPTDGQTEKAIAEFSAAVEKYKTDQRSFDRKLIAAFSLAGLIVVGSIGGMFWYFISELGTSTGIFCGGALILLGIVGLFNLFK
jgi:hypothetical protein